MSGKKEITDLEEQFSNLSDHDLYAVIATLTKWSKHIESVLKTAKNEYARQRDSGNRDELRFNSKTVGEISIRKGSTGRYIVKDPKAYAAILKQIQWTLDDGRDAWYTTIMPCDEACKPDFLDELIRAHAGEIPKGVEYKNGTSASVAVSLNDGYANSALDVREIVKVAMLQIEEGKNE